MTRLLKYGWLLTLLLLAACRSTKDATSFTPTPQQEEYIKHVAEKALTSSSLTAKAEVELQLNNKPITLNGSLRLMRNEVVQLSLTFFGIEVARLEFLPECVLVIDRTNKRYVRAKYADVDFLRDAGLDFYTLQAIFWNEIFVPGERSATDHTADFFIQKVGNETLLLLQNKPKLNYEFRTETASAHLTRTAVTPKQGGLSVYCNYDNFKKVENIQFPTHIALGISGERAIGITLNLSRINTGESFATRTQLSSRYTPISSADLLGIISKLMP